MHKVKMMSMSTVTTTKAISTAARSRCHYHHRLRYINKRKSLYSASFAEFSFLRPEVIACSSPGRFLSSSNKNNGIPSKYLTNGGTIEGVWVFHRHGDRAPNRYLGSDTYLDAESDHWHSRIPSRSDGISGPYLKNKFLASATPSKTITTAATTTAYQALSNYFPPSIHPSQNNGLFLDVDREPFGFLTWRGMDQMRGVGQKMRRRYERFGYRVDGTSYSGSGSGSGRGQQTATPPSSSSSESSSSSLLPSNNYSFLDHWNVQAYSTNYLRTVMSVQCFLDGLIAKQREVNCTTISNEHNKTNAMDNSTTASASSKATETMKGSYIKAGGGLPRYYKDVAKHEQLTHVDTSTLTTMEDMKPISNNVIKVQVRDKVVDTLNAFDRFPQMMNGLVRDVIATEQFQR